MRRYWVQISAKDGTVLFEKILDAGERYVVPDLPEAPLLRAGNSHAIYFAVDGRTYGPASPDAKVVKNLPLSVDTVTQTFAAADPALDVDLARFADLAVPAGPALPQTAAGPVAPLPPVATTAGN
ncbi:MAG: DUF4115 domain-containing protein [Rhodobacteraceae bacterium]|nr:DUF4115 domain-containing protein [Paracoccaceae bacterium]